MKLVVTELLVDGHPDLVRHGLWGTHDGVHVLGNGVKDPTENALIDDMPIGITVLGGGWRGRNVGGEAEFAKEGVEEASPLVVIGLGELQNNWHMRFDVNRLKNGNRWLGGGGGRNFAVDGGVRRGRNGRRSDTGEVEERIVVHVFHGDAERRWERRSRERGGGEQRNGRR